MPFSPSAEVSSAVVRARIALGITQKELGDMFGASTRSAGRWEAGRAYPTIEQIHQLARAVFPKDPRIAAELAAEGGTTLEALGLVARTKTVGASPAAPAPRAYPPIGLVIDSVVLAALDAAASHTESPLREREAVLDILRAGATRAQGLGLCIDELVHGLKPGASNAEASPREKTKK